jgi:hypothetical protein
VVVDDDRDGVPDRRYGIDNLPRTMGDDSSHHREWFTDLDTGRTEWAVDKDYALYRATGFNSGYPGYGDGEGFHSGRDGARFRFGHVFDTTQGTKPRGVKVDMPFYTWASVIVNGRVVATDYAPDAGWLLPSPGAKPGGTYVLDDPFPLRLSMSIGDGWAAYGRDRSAGGVTRDEEKTGVLFVIVDNPSLDPCGDPVRTNDPRLGPSVDDLVTFLERLRSIAITEQADVTLDGYRGTYLEFTKTGENECSAGGWSGWPTNTSLDGVEYNRVWILDVDGVRLVIDSFATSPSESVKAELRQIVESIRIEP